MELKVLYSGYNVKYFAGAKMGKGMPKLIKFVGANKDKISLIKIIGKSDSYTFLRQIYLFANLSAVLLDVKVCINSREVTLSRPALPVYER